MNRPRVQGPTLRGMAAVLRREWGAMVRTPLAVVFLLVFVLAAPALTFYAGDWLARGRADLEPFFRFHPWLFLLLAPALAMRLWAEEFRLGTDALLLSLPVPLPAVVLGKFLATWLFGGVALLLTVPMWITVSLLGAPDHGVIAASYIGSWVMLGGFLALASAASAATRTQAVAFLLGLGLCFVLLVAGTPLVLDLVRGWAPLALVDAVAALSMLGRFAAVGQGVLALSDLVHACALIAAGLLATLVLVAARRQPGGPRRAGRLAARLAGIGAGFLLATWLGQALAGGARLDVTQARLHTLSPGTRAVLAELREPIRLELILSRRALAGYPALQSHAGQVEALLRSYVRAAHGRLDLVVTTPEPVSEAEDRALAAGLTAVPTPEGDSLLFGLVGTNAGSGRELIALFTPERAPLLEYDLTRLVSRLAQPVKPRVAIVSALPLAFGLGGPIGYTQGRSSPFLIYEQLREAADVVLLDPRFGAVPETVTVLMLALPPPLGPAQVAAIDAFVQRGGRVLALVDPFSETAASASGLFGPNPNAPVQAALLELLLSRWGAPMAADAVVGDARYAEPVTFGSERIVYLPQLGIPATGLDRDDLITQGLSLVRLDTAGALRLALPPGVTAQPLITSSDEAGLIPAEAIAGVPDPAGLLQTFRPGGTQLLGVRLTGRFPSVITPGARSRETSIIVIADSDLLDDRNWTRSQTLLGERLISVTADNATLVLNALDVLMGSNALLSLRKRATPVRPLSALSARQAAGEMDLRQREAALVERWQATQARIRALEQGGGDGRRFLGATQAAEIAQLRRSGLETRAALRQVQRALRQVPQVLERQVVLANLVPVPLMLMAGAALLAWRRRRAAAALPEA